MRIATKIRLGIIALVLVGVGVFWVKTWLFGKGEIHVLAPPDRGVTVTLDGKAQAIAAGGHWTFSVKQGAHTIDIVDDAGEKSTRKVKLSSGFTRLVVPVSPAQCFARFDVTHAAYAGGVPTQPTLESRIKAEPFTIPSNTYLLEGELPSSIEEGTHVHLIYDMPCDELEKTDAEIVNDMGFKVP